MTELNFQNKTTAKAVAKIIVLLTMAWSTSAAAELHKCKRSDGKTTYQETPCAFEPTQKQLLKDAGSGDDSSPALSACASSETITLSNSEKRYPLIRTPSKSQAAACIAAHRADLANTAELFNVNSKLFKRLWQLDNGAAAERNFLVVNLQEKNRLNYAERITFTRTLRGDQSIDRLRTLI